jgi:hypothetical protein
MRDIYNSCVPWLFALDWCPERWAVTLGQTTWWTVSKAEVDAAPAWRRHEDCHKAQFARDGWSRFLRRYVWEWIAGVFRYHNFTDAYLQISYELEAQEAER